MKKTTSMRVALGMLALTLITSCFVGGTFAKYTTSGKATDTARVAKFGVKVTATGDAFSTEYATHDDSAIATIGTKSVISSNAEKVVAPGTSGSFTNVSITGKPEVAVEVANTATTVELGDKWVDADGTYYCPLTITVNGTAYYGLDYDDADAFEAAVKAAINGNTQKFAPNTELNTVTAVAVSWAWAFEGTDGKQTDIKDTYLGDQAAEGNAATITIEISTTVTQID